MSQFNVGDKIVRKVEYLNRNDWRHGEAVITVVRGNNVGLDIDDGNGCFWDERYFDLVPAEETVSNEVEKQVPGVPDGYRLVRIGAPKKGEFFITSYNMVVRADENMYEYCWPVVEKIEPAKPKTRSVVLNRYLVWDADIAGSHRVIVAEEDYVTDNWQNFTLLGHSETIEVEV